MKTVRVEVYGRAQGVGFRVTVKGLCDLTGIRGYVANRDDGSVLIVAQGNVEKLDELIEKIKGSPRLSKIERVIVQEVTAKFYYKDFKVVRERSFFEDQKKAIGNLVKGKF